MSELSPEAKGLLAAVRDGDEMADADKARHRRQLLTQLAVASASGAGATLAAKTAAANAAIAVAGGVGATGAATTTSAIVGTTLLTKLAGAVLIVGVVGGGAVGVRTMVRERAPSTPQAPPAILATAHAVSAALPATPNQAPREASPIAPVPTETSSSEGLPGVAPLEARPPVPLKAPVASASPLPKPREPSLEEETALLRGAHEALQAGNAAHALALLDEHARSYPHGLLVEERGAQRILVLCALGSRARARAEAAVFLSERPSSPLAPRVRTSCVAK